MADENSRDKKAKLANTRKRFKELQELKKKKEASASPTASLDRSSVSPSLSPITIQLPQSDASPNIHQHSLADSQHPENVQQQTYTSKTLNLPTTADQSSIGLPSYFAAPNHADFFDNVASSSASSEVQKPQRSQETQELTHFDTTEEDNPQENTEQNIGLAKYFDNSSPNFENISSQQFHGESPMNINYSLFPSMERKQSYVSEMHQITHPTHNTDRLTEEDPVISSSDTAMPQINQGYPKKLPDIFGSQGETRNLINYLDNQNAQNVSNQAESSDVITDSTMSPDYPEISDLPSGSTQSLTDYYLNLEALRSESDEIKDQISKSTDTAKQEAQLSNVECLRQLSDQLAHMVDPSYEFSAPGGITDLEKRNLELAANLEREKLNSENLRRLNQEYISEITDLNLKLSQLQSSTDLQGQQEISRLKDELKSHFQTIGVLVAEKTDLAAMVNQHELNSKQKNAECEELQARLKASRSRVADLERELHTLKEEKSKIENLGGQYSLSYEVVKKEYEVLRDQKEELAQDLLETQAHLKQALDENVLIKQQNKDLTGKLSLADVKIQQLTSSGDLSGVNSQIEQLTQQKFALENELSKLNKMLKSFIKERDEARSEYQHYAEQLNAQISNLQTTVENLQQEKENLVMQEQNRIKHIGELERQLQTLQDNQVCYATKSTSNSDLKSELEQYKEMVVQLETEKNTLEQNHTTIINEKELLMKELEAKSESIAVLESMLEQLRGNQPDSVKLLATMESDKVAAARAVQQNKDLKLQMESMQEVFAKLDNDKITLTDQLEFEHKTNKELMEKLQKTEIHLQTLADAIEIKDKELSHLRNSFGEINRQALQHEQLEDRLRHYEAHEHSAHALQNELMEAKTTIAKLTNELNQLKNIQGNWDNKTTENEAIENIDSRENDRIVELTNDINRLKAELSEQSNITKNLENLQINGHIDDTQSDANENTLDKETTVKFLEDKVKRTMQEIADLSDEKQRLEHIILQLQGETETIGEYVALYQHQRMILKQKALEKDYQLKQLATDRELIKGKLDRLNQLIKKLVTEKGVIPEELIQHQENINIHASNLCQMHSKMNDAVNNRIAQEKDVQNITLEEENVDADVDSKASRTAEEIISLLSEIKTSNLVEPEDSFHHCPYCSGQLITV